MCFKSSDCLKIKCKTAKAFPLTTENLRDEKRGEEEEEIVKRIKVSLCICALQVQCVFATMNIIIM